MIPSAPAPVSFDGNVAGQAADYVFMLVPDANPRTPGFSLRAGESLQVAMPVSFKRDLSVAIVPDKDTNLVLTKGWPQGAVPLAGQYRIDFDEKSNAMIITASRDVGLDGTNAPGIKVIHLRGRTFINPVPGDYPLMVTRVSAQGKPQSVWQSNLKVLDAAPAARLAPTNFHVMLGTNTDYQTVAMGQTTAHPLGVLLWGTHGAALNGVGIAQRDLARYPRYTGGLLVQDTNGDKRLDPAVETRWWAVLLAPHPKAHQGRQRPARSGRTARRCCPAKSCAVPAFQLQQVAASPIRVCSLLSFALATSLACIDRAWS